ncbi:MAG: serine--tRNA ligase [Bacilli bacterium]
MLDIKEIRKNPEKFKEGLKLRGEQYVKQIDDILALDVERRRHLTEVEQLKNLKNDLSKQIGLFKRDGKDTNELIVESEKITSKIEKFDEEIATIDKRIFDIIILIPNLVHKDVAFGKDEEDNVLIRTFGSIPQFDFVPKAHYELGEKLGILDFEGASRIVGSRFTLLKKDAARLERALTCYMMDLHTIESDYVEVIPPYIVNRETMTNAGKLPKFEDDAFKFYSNQDWFLNSTAEIPLIGYFSNQVLQEADLPINIAGYTTAFRKEAGSAGRDTRGMLRQHQFKKVELFKVASPDNSYEQLEEMVKQSEKVLQGLNIPYRVVSLCTGDLGETSTKTYDIEVWLPSQEKYREIASISNTETYQSMRANVKFKRENSKKLEYVHLLNGSGVAVGRCMIAIMENYQNEDGSITVPEVLIPYMKKNIIK